MILTIDASVAVKWVIEEPGSTIAVSYLPRWQGDSLHLEHTFRAPALLGIELHHAVAKRFRNGLASLDQLAGAHFVLERFGRLDPVDTSIVDQARIISFTARDRAAKAKQQERPKIGSTFNIYDCIYIAHAQRYGTALLTADDEQAKLAQQFDVAVEFVSSR